VLQVTRQGHGYGLDHESAICAHHSCVRKRTLTFPLENRRDSRLENGDNDEDDDALRRNLKPLVSRVGAVCDVSFAFAICKKRLERDHTQVEGGTQTASACSWHGM
jgi:hypothetical protein